MNLLKSAYHFILAWLGSVLYGRPSRRIFVLGVTGTKGKSTILELISAILQEAGKKTALVSSIHTKIGDESVKNTSSNTMPGRFLLQKFLKRAVEGGCDYALIEVTSQGVLQFRHRFIDFDAAMITNLSPEHIEAHGGYEKYRNAKVKFFEDMEHSVKGAKHFFINEVLPWKEYFERASAGVGGIIYFSREDFIRNDLSRHYNLESDSAKKMISEWLRNDFNLENVAAAVAFANNQNIPDAVIFSALQKFKGVPGRMEYVQREPFTVVVDYAHTPESLQAVYETLLKQGAKRLVAVFGAAGGGRDKWKREEMGRIAARLCGEIILTDEDSYDEDPQEILSEIEKGIWKERGLGEANAHYQKILDRRQAIFKAISLAKKGDAVILTGKGSESWIHMARGRKLPWNEREVVAEALGRS